MTRRTPMHSHGDHISLITGDRDPLDYEVIRGHVTLEEARSISTLCGVGWPGVLRIEHAYGRWSCETSLDFDMTLREYDGPGRGRFPITRCRWEGVAG